MLLGLLWESQLQVLYYWWSSPLPFVVAAMLNVEYQGIHLQQLQPPRSLFLPLSLSTQQTLMASKVVSASGRPIQFLELASTRHHLKLSRCLPTLLYCRLHTHLQPMHHTFPLTHLSKLRDTFINHKRLQVCTTYTLISRNMLWNLALSLEHLHDFGRCLK